MNTEEAYQTIAKVGCFVFEKEPWDSLIVECKIHEKMVSRQVFRVVSDQVIPATVVAPFEMSKQSTKAALFLRDDILKTTGHRIWGFTMKVTSSGQFTIDYDYNKPDLG